MIYKYKQYNNQLLFYNYQSVEKVKKHNIIKYEVLAASSITIITTDNANIVENSFLYD